MDVADRLRVPPVIPVSVLGMSFFGGGFHGRRVRIITRGGDWHEDSWHVWSDGPELGDDGHEYVEVIPAADWWAGQALGATDISRVLRWPAGAVFLD